MTQYLLQYLPSWAAVALGTSSSEASAVIVVFAAGSVTGVLVGGKLHDMLGPRGRLWTVMLFAVIVGLGGMALPIVFAVTGREHFTIRSIIGFLPPVAFAGAILNYITCTVYFAQVGGKKHTATAATVADVLGIGASAIVQLIAGQMMDHENYLGVLVLLGGTSVGMAGCFMLFAYSVYYYGVREKGTTASALDAVPDR
jgi:MFS family permease